MIYNGKKLETFDEIFNEGLRLAREDKDKALNFFGEYVRFLAEVNNKPIEEAEEAAKSNFGYFAGYYNAEVCEIIYNTFQCCHPIFGDKPFDVPPEQAYQAGLKIGSNL